MEEKYLGFEKYASLYHAVEAYAKEKQLQNTLRALTMLCEIMSCNADQIDARYKSPGRHLAYIRHSLAVTHMLIDFRIPLSSFEEDVTLAATVCHVLPENIKFTDLKAKMVEEYQLDAEVYTVVDLITREDGQAEALNRIFFENIQKHKLALLIKLADRGNLVEQLYRISIWSAREYIHETRMYFFPMCIYAKEHYPEILGTINVMMEKMRCHIEVSEILLTRYEAKEMQLTKDILELREENSRIRLMIQKLQNEQ